MRQIYYKLSDNIESKILGASMISIFEQSHEKILVHVLIEKNISSINRKKLVDIIRKFDHQIIFHNDPEEIPETNFIDTNIFARDEKFLSYFIKTPFCNIESFEKIFNDCVQKFNNEKNLTADHFSHIQQILKLTITRPRVFFMRHSDLDEVKNIFGISKKTVAIDSEQVESMNDLINAMKNSNLNSQRKSIYYLHVDNEKYLQIKTKLESEGFIEFEDFFNSKTIF